MGKGLNLLSHVQIQASPDLLETFTAKHLCTWCVLHSTRRCWRSSHLESSSSKLERRHNTFPSCCHIEVWTLFDTRLCQKGKKEANRQLLQSLGTFFELSLVYKLSHNTVWHTAKNRGSQKESGCCQSWPLLLFLRGTREYGKKKIHPETIRDMRDHYTQGF